MIWVILSGALLFLIAVVIFCIAPGALTSGARDAAGIFRIKNFAHRGLFSADQVVPENSLSAFSAARDEGYGVELDVQLSKDGQVVVFHDDALIRVCRVDTPIREMKLAELSALRLFSSDEHIPLLSEALEILGDTPVIVELKSARARNPELCTKTLDILRAHGGNWCVESFDPRILAWFRKTAPDVLRGQLSALPREFTSESKPVAFALGNLLMNFLSRPHFIAYKEGPLPFTVRMCRAMKPMTVIWTVNPKSDIKRCEKDHDAVVFEHYKPNR